MTKIRNRIYKWFRMFNISNLFNFSYLLLIVSDLHFLERPGGVEPPTNGLGNRCSIQLSYGRPINQYTVARS
jgi:hypothetical protein